jgi:hypothetical protein
VFRTPFGKVELDSPQWYRCRCEPQNQKTFSPLAEVLPERTSPELVYLETKFAALVSYGLSVQLLHEILPLGQGLSTTTVRRRVRQTAERLESERGGPQADLLAPARPEAQDALPAPTVPLVVGHRGRESGCTPPPSEPDWRISRITALQSVVYLPEDWRATAWACFKENKPRVVK